MARESLETKRLRASAVVKRLKKEFPVAQTALHHKNPYELLIATILSAQCTDVLVNKITPNLFETAPTPSAMAELSVDEIEFLISKVNFFRNKAKNISHCCKKLVDEYNSIVPNQLEQLISLPGVGRKTASVVLTSAFSIPAMVVDTHVLRLANRLAFTTKQEPEKVETDLKEVFDKQIWVKLSHLLILHGRKTCKAQNPLCAKCQIVDLCPSAFKKSTAWKR
jgi:endonuclease-3